MLHSRKVLTIKEVVNLIGLSKASIYRQIKDGCFPPPIQLSTRRVGFIYEDIGNWIENKKFINGKENILKDSFHNKIYAYK